MYYDTIVRRQYSWMIRSFRDRETKRIANGEYSSRFPVDIQRREDVRG